ncbi:MAG: phospholipase [Chlorobium sp.]|nr:MAG: phospholipase [Chlorobium sp.]
MLQRRHLSLTFLDLAPAAPDNAPIMMLLHGYGSNEKDLIQLAPMLHGGLRYISVRAPHTLDLGMFGWFPLSFTPTGIAVDYVAAEEARLQFISFIHDILAEYKPAGNKVFLMGFSQGAVMSYMTAFSEPELLHGVIACSGQLPDMRPKDDNSIKKLPFLVLHGIYDDILQIAKGRAANEWLEERVNDLTYSEYPIAHQIADKGIELIHSWLEKRAPESLE